ncbi:MAG: SMC-Scp complex subunit ScpB [Ignavibacteriae bacterium]|nr:SMC-Scp complex subunit ScpB [Ignavibacteria bacterium]MBI3365450.1 SMC-Scp complex subunit ScpB [Ignavibacteriota bacterium]
MTEPISESKRHIIEALLFASDEPLSVAQIIDILKSAENSGPRIRMKEDEVVNTIRELNGEYVQAGRSFRIIQVAGGFQFATMPEFAEWLGRMVKEKARRKLSQAVIETLSVIAYKQPITKPEIEAIRGVNADYAIQRLMERGLVTIVGRSATAGRPLLYGTTSDFLKHFGLNDLSDLPKPREIEEIMADQGFEMEKEILKRMGKTDEEIEEQLGKTVVGADGELRELPPDEPPPSTPSASEDNENPPQ